MKRKLGYPTLIIAVVSLSLFGCASSDSNMDTTTGTVVENDESDSQAQRDSGAEDTTSAFVSANNEIGREMNIVARVQQNPNLSTFFELIRAADMVTMLELATQYTVFAPTNQAFAALPAGTLEDLTRPDNQIELRRLLQSHVLPNKITSAEMRNNMAMKTEQGDEVIARRNGQALTVGDANVIMTDVDAANGVIHVIDKVLVPPPR